MGRLFVFGVQSYAFLLTYAINAILNTIIGRLMPWREVFGFFIKITIFYVTYNL